MMAMDFDNGFDALLSWSESTDVFHCVLEERRLQTAPIAHRIAPMKSVDAQGPFVTCVL